MFHTPLALEIKFVIICFSYFLGLINRVPTFRRTSLIENSNATVSAQAGSRFKLTKRTKIDCSLFLDSAKIRIIFKFSHVSVLSVQTILCLNAYLLCGISANRRLRYRRCGLCRRHLHLSLTLSHSGLPRGRLRHRLRLRYWLCRCRQGSICCRPDLSLR